jgi:hypothetical protein
MASEVTAFLRALPEGAEEVLASADLDALTQQALSHGLAPLLWDEACRAHVALPSPAREEVRRRALANSAAGVRLQALASRVLASCNREGLSPVLLKGQALAQRLYRNPWVRPSGDIDLWVPEEMQPQAKKALIAAGLAQRPIAGGDSPQVHETQWVAASGMVELHHRLLSTFGTPIDGGGLWERTVEEEWEGHRVRFLFPEDELAYLAVHATHHLFSRVGWLYDIKLFLLRHPALDASFVLRAAEEMNAEPLAYFGLELARRILDASVPGPVLRALEPPEWKRWMFGGLFSEDRVAAKFFGKHKWAFYGAKAVLAPSLWQMRHLAWHRISRWVH